MMEYRIYVLIESTTPGDSGVVPYRTTSLLHYLQVLQVVQKRVAKWPDSMFLYTEHVPVH